MIIRTDSKHPDFVELVRELDIELAKRDGEEHGFYAQYNKIDLIKNVVILYENNNAVACGAFKEIENGLIEIKRMYTKPNNRGKGLALLVLTELEKWTYELGFKNLVLETGKKQPEAIALYQKAGYEIIENYGQYKGIDNSLCFGKGLKAKL